MNTLEAIQTRRSVRAFAPDPIPKELLEQVLQAGRAAPSGSNVQAWGFVLVRSPDRVESLRALAPGMIGRPTAVIAICLDRRRAQHARLLAEQLVLVDMGIAAENMLLAAHDLGLGACAIGSFHRQAVAAFLRLPEDVDLVLLMSLGYPARQPKKTSRRPMGEVCFREEWSVPYE